jgi:stearoyl-CoA desaturase (delta-9 desaturase)
VIWLFEKAGAASEVKWPRPERIAAKMVKAASS